MDKNLPAKAEDTGLIPGLGRFHMPWSKSAHTAQLLSLSSKARKLQLLRPMCPGPVLCNKRNHDNEKSAHGKEDPVKPKIIF